MTKMQEKMVASALEKFKNSDKFRELERQAQAEKERIDKLETFKERIYFLIFDDIIDYSKVKDVIEELGLYYDFMAFCDDNL